MSKKAIDGTSETLVEVGVDLPEDVGMEREWLWALPADNGLFRIQSIPFFAYGVNYGDVVRCMPDPSETEGMFLLEEVVKPSGYRTFRIILSEGITNEAEATTLADIDTFSVMREQGMDRIYAIAVPPDADLPGFFRYLIGRQEKGVLNFEIADNFDDEYEDEVGSEGDDESDEEEVGK